MSLKPSVKQARRPKGSWPCRACCWASCRLLSRATSLLYVSHLLPVGAPGVSWSTARRAPPYRWTTFANVEYLTFRLLLRCLRSRTARSLARLLCTVHLSARSFPQGRHLRAPVHGANALDTLFYIITVVPHQVFVIIKSRYCKKIYVIKNQVFAIVVLSADTSS